jgi:hypothetical protein
MGDHRADSTDSRVFGAINKEDVVGRAWLRYWPLTDLGILTTPSYAGVPPASVADGIRGADGYGLAGAGLGLLGAAGAAAVLRAQTRARVA